jgi:prevent-host-death family protein
MREQAISVTEAARNFADCVNRARYQGMSFVLHKNGVPVARLVPVEPSTAEEPAAVIGGATEASKSRQPSISAVRRDLNW